MIDIHAHILPTLDHGAKDWDEALELCRIAVSDGITGMAATPHVNEIFHNTRETIVPVVEEGRRRLAEAGIPLELFVGGDYHIHPALSPENVVTLNDNGRYFLLEFPYQVIPPNSELFIELLIKRGLIPIVTHPERIYTLYRSESRLEPLIEKGALVQITAASITGQFGPECAYSSEVMLKKGWVHIIASDAHWVDERPPVLTEGLEIAARWVGDEAARKMVDDHPRAVIEGKEFPA